MGTFTDIRDGEIYQTVNIGTQTWMAENFRGNFGTNLVTDDLSTKGRYYQYNTEIAPSGWHLPSRYEYDILLSNLSNPSAGNELIAVSDGGTDIFGFKVLILGLMYDGRLYNSNTAYLVTCDLYFGNPKVIVLANAGVDVTQNFVMNIAEYGNVRYIKDVYDPGNVSPTDIALSNNTINEHGLINDTVGVLSSTDADVGNTFTYTLVTGTGDTNNTAFNISGDLLRASILFDYTIKSTYSIRIRTTDNQSGYFEKVFIINVVDIDSPPTNIILSNNVLTNTTQLNSTIGTLSSVDVDPSDTFTYTLVSGTGDTDNASFSISGDTLVNNITFDYNTKSSYSVRVRSTDYYSEYFEQQFQLNVSFPYGTSGKTIDYLTYLPQHLKDSEVYEFVKVFQDFSNGLYNTSLSAYPSYTAKYDDSNNISTGTKVVGISILEKIKKIAELRDPSMIDLDYVKYFASMFGYEINISRQDINTFLTGADIETSTSTAREFDINQHIRESLEVSPWFNKLKTSKTALQFILYSFGIIGYIKDVYTTDYKNEWIVFYNDASQTLETFVTKECYPTPHFRLTVDLENTPTNWRNNITKIIDVVDTLKPIQTVFDGIEMFLLSHATVYVHIASILKQTSVMGWNGPYAYLRCDIGCYETGGEFNNLEYDEGFNVGAYIAGQYKATAFTNAFKIGNNPSGFSCLNCVDCNTSANEDLCSTSQQNYTAPSQVLNVLAVAGNTSASISFDPPLNDGGDPISYYTIQNILAPNVPIAEEHSSPINIIGLTNGTEYTFTVKARNDYGYSTPVTSNSVTPSAPLNQFTDARDGEIYQTVNIGTQTWMAENFRGNFGTNLDVGLNPLNRPTLGKWYSPTTAIAQAPTGWHLPTPAEFNTLISFAGGEGSGSLKNAEFDNGTDSLGFNIRKSGMYYPGGILLMDLGVLCSTLDSSPFYYALQVDGPTISVQPSYLIDTLNNVYLACVRYIKD